jgi:hypothetical protein
MTPAAMTGPAPTLRRRAAGPLFLSFTLAALAAWSWRKWPDLLVDFGRELYVPWQLSQGKVLYRDLALNYGPLPPYLNAVLFKLFGVSITTLICCNLALLTGLTALIYSLLARACGRLTAFVAGLFFLLVFAFPQYSAIGSMNFIAPYSHAATHGMVLAVAMIFSLGQWKNTGRRFWAALAGLCLGAALLTKPEIFLATAAAAGVWAGLILLEPKSGSRSRIQALALLGLAALVPALLFAIYFSIHLPWASAVRAVLSAWTYALNPELSRNYYYRFGMGLEDLRASLILMLKMFGYLAAFFALATLADLTALRSQANLRWLAPLLGLALAAGLGWKSDLIPWLDLPRALTLTTLLAGAGLLWKWLKLRQDPQTAAPYFSLLVWSAFTLALLPKMFFNVRFYHYGFYLAMPAMLTLVVVLVWLWPSLLARNPHGGYLFRSLALAALTVCAGHYWLLSQQFYGFKNFRIGQGSDLILGYDRAIHPRDFFFAEALQWIERETPPSATLAALPEGTMLNYLSRRINPTPYVYFTMVEMISFGEDNMLRALQKTQPDYLVLEHLSSEDYGVGYFGEDPRYGKSIMDWAANSYQLAVQIGPEPSSDDQFNIKIFKRNPPAR